MTSWPRRCPREVAVTRTCLRRPLSEVLGCYFSATLRFRCKISLYSHFPDKPGKIYGHLAAKANGRLFLSLWLLVWMAWGLTWPEFGFVWEVCVTKQGGSVGPSRAGSCSFFLFTWIKLEILFDYTLSQTGLWVFSRLDSLKRSFSGSRALLSFPLGLPCLLWDRSWWRIPHNASEENFFHRTIVALFFLYLVKCQIFSVFFYLETFCNRKVKTCKRMLMYSFNLNHYKLS